MPESRDERFRDAVRDSLVLLKKLSPLCNSTGDLVGMLELALTNDAQLQLLENEVTPLDLRMRKSA